MKLTSQETIKLAYQKGYRVTEDGKVYNPKGYRMAVNSKDNKRYPQVNIKHDGIKYTVRMHRIAAYCFYRDEMFEEGILVRHLDDDKTNVSKANIVLGTQTDNMSDISDEKQAVMSERKRKYALENGIKPPRIAKLSEDQITEILSLLDSGKSYRSIAKKFHVHHSSVYYVKKTRRDMNGKDKCS